MKNLLKITTKPIRIAVVRPEGSPVSKVNDHNNVTEKNKVQVDKVLLKNSKPVKMQSQPKISLQTTQQGNTSTDLLLKHMEEAKSSHSVIMPITSRISFMPQHVVRNSSFYASLLRFKVEQFNEIKFEFTGDFIRVPHRGNTQNKE